MPIAGDTYDISLQQDSSATEYGFMLARDKGRPLYESLDAPTLNPGYYSTDPNYSSQPPLLEMSIPLDEWHAGFGLQDSSKGVEKRYRSSYGADMRQKGRAYNGPASSTLTLPTDFAPNVGNAGFELVSSGSTLLGWVIESDTGTWARSSAQKQAGSYSGLSSGGDGSDGVFYQSIGDYSLFKGKTLTFTCYVYQALVTQGKIRIDDGVGTTDSSTSATTGSWVQLSVQRAIDANATRLRLYLINDNNGSQLFFDTAAIALTSGSTATTGNYARFIEFNGALYLARGTSLIKYTGSGNWTYVTGVENTITDLAVLGSQLFIAQGSANFMYYSAASDDSTWDIATTANNKAQYLCEIDGTLWYNDSVYQIRNITSANGAASAQTTVGLTTTDILDLTHGFDGLLYIRKEDQPYQRSSAGAIAAIMPEAISETSSSGGPRSLSYKGDWYIPMGSQSLYRWGAATDIEAISPSKFAPGESDFGGEVLALAGDSEWLFAIIDNSTKVEVMAVRQESIEGSTDWRWHPLAELTFSTCYHAWVSTIGSKRLWLCGATGDTPTFYYLPANYGDPTTDTSYSRNTSGVFYTPWYSGGFMATNKAFFSAEVLGDNLSATKTITIAYQFPGDSNWNRALTVFNDQEVQYFAADDVAKKIRFKVTLASDSATAGPVLRGLIIRGALMPTKLRQFNFTLRVGDQVGSRAGVESQYTGGDLRTALSAMNSETWPVILRDVGNTSYNVKFQQMTTRVILDELDRVREEWYDIVATECKIA